MYDQFRLDILRELVKNGLDNKIMQKVMGALDMVSAGYEIAKKETALVPFESESQRLVMEYLACKSLEGLSKLTLSAYRNRLKWFMGLIQKPIKEATTNDIRAFLYQYQSMRHISNRTLDSIRTTLNSFFSWAHYEGRIANNPCAAIQPIKYTATPRTALSQLEMEYIRRACGPIREKAIVTCMTSQQKPLIC